MAMVATISNIQNLSEHEQQELGRRWLITMNNYMLKVDGVKVEFKEVND